MKVCKVWDDWEVDRYGNANLVIMEYLVNISKRRAFWSLNEDILKINDSDNQYAVSIKEDTAYPCLHSPKTTKETSSIRHIQRNSIRRIQDIEDTAYPCLYSPKPQRKQDQYAVSREDQYAVLEIWNEYNILEDIKRGPYFKKSPIRCIRYSEKDKNNGKTDKTEHGIKKSARNQSRRQSLKLENVIFLIRCLTYEGRRRSFTMRPLRMAYRDVVDLRFKDTIMSDSEHSAVTLHIHSALLLLRHDTLSFSRVPGVESHRGYLFLRDHTITRLGAWPEGAEQAPPSPNLQLFFVPELFTGVLTDLPEDLEEDDEDLSRIPADYPSDEEDDMMSCISSCELQCCIIQLTGPFYIVIAPRLGCPSETKAPTLSSIRGRCVESVAFTYSPPFTFLLHTHHHILSYTLHLITYTSPHRSPLALTYVEVLWGSRALAAGIRQSRCSTGPGCLEEFRRTTVSGQQSEIVERYRAADQRKKTADFRAAESRLIGGRLDS
ncbi:hypothetical protein Tco_0375613 [Tanacetum coccineum]